MCCLFAATYPERVSALVLYASYAKRRDPDEDYPWAATWEARQAYAAEVERGWGTDADRARMGAEGDAAFAAWYLRRARAAASPGAARDLILMNSQIDVRHVLPVITAPTLVLHRTGDADSSVEEGRYIAERVAGARFVELAGDSHMRSRTSSRASGTGRTATACWRQSFSPTSSARRRRLSRSAIAGGPS